MNETAPDLILPDRLKRGDTVGIAIPAGPIIREDEFATGVRLLTDMGYKVRIPPDYKRMNSYLAGTDKERAAELNSFFADPEIKAIVAARGGYGSLRIVADLDMASIKRNPKIIIGFSDICVLLTAIHRNTGLVTFHGPMLSTLQRLNSHFHESFFSMLAKPDPQTIKPSGLEILIKGSARGKLVGGNLTNLLHLLATPFELSWENCILFLEDVNESSYRVDRILTHLKHAGRLDSVRGLILGTFENCDNMENIWARAMELFGDTNIPIWANFPTGHGENNQILPIGVEAEMDGATGKLKFLGPCIA
ncbi:MAG: LD-carboxypeptidase [Proteobacteria bacterium]|nr:LD-carboxypeptidase [Pseudomonadota bacterium]MBU1711079.1 LD-carboxypeptidase [Pseudomonadota bacterium]